MKVKLRGEERDLEIAREMKDAGEPKDKIFRFNGLTIDELNGI